MADLRGTLTGIYQKHGELTPELVVEESRPETAPLHKKFEWDDAIAGEEYRRVQAAEIIRSVRVVFAVTDKGERKFVRAFHSRTASGDSERGGYAPTEEIVQDEMATKILLKQLERDLSDIRRKYGHLKEFVAMIRDTAEAVAS